MKKKFVAIAAAATLVMAVLAGCGSTDTSNVNAATAASEAPGSEAAPEAASSEAVSSEAPSSEAAADLSGSISMAGSTSMEKFANALAESFMAKYPGVTVTADLPVREQVLKRLPRAALI